MAEVGAWAVLVASIATLAVSAFVLFLDFRQRVHRAFALFLLLRAIMDGLLFFNETTTDLAGRLRMYFYIAMPLAALHFALAYLHRHGRRPSERPTWIAPLAILIVALGFELAYFLDHGLAGDEVGPGPLLAFVFLPWPAYAGITLLFALENGRTQRESGRKALELAALGFSLVPLFVSTMEILFSIRGWFRGDTLPGWLAWVQFSAHALSILLLLVSMRLLLRAPALGYRAFLVPWASVLAVAVVVVALDSPEVLLRTVFAVCAFALSFLVTYALVKHRLFDMEVRLRFAIRGTTLAGLFLAVFFIVNKVTENIVATRFDNEGVGIYVGGAVAGLLLFALSPLQRLADRIAQKAAPQVPVGLPAAEREQIYREQLEIAWRDGRLTAKERLLFTQLQERLGIAAGDATRLETEVLHALDIPAGRRKRATPA